MFHFIYLSVSFWVFQDLLHYVKRFDIKPNWYLLTPIGLSKRILDSLLFVLLLTGLVVLQYSGTWYKQYGLNTVWEIGTCSQVTYTENNDTGVIDVATRMKTMLVPNLTYLSSSACYSDICPTDTPSSPSTLPRTWSPHTSSTYLPIASSWF